MACSKTAFAKIVLLFFAVLFTAVLIHPDLDLLDVHDVKISSVRSLPHSVEGHLVPQIITAFARPPLLQSFRHSDLSSTDLTVSPSDLNLSVTLRI